ncbi:hypothetical protein ACFU3O_06180 [Streptomyces antibioticus]|uniref:hypothetical protein n=1 Tax=Streptomyces antibioticus TaxID=1890 RepID=UPI00369AEDE2
MALDTDTFDIFRTGRRRSHGAPALARAENTGPCAAAQQVFRRISVPDQGGVHQLA